MWSCDEDEFWLFVEIVRRVWFRWNETVHGGPLTHPTVLAQQAREALADFSMANNRELVLFSNLEKPKGDNNLRVFEVSSCCVCIPSGRDWKVGL